jgi:hypothetical protein
MKVQFKKYSNMLLNWFRKKEEEEEEEKRRKLYIYIFLFQDNRTSTASFQTISDN